MELRAALWREVGLGGGGEEGMGGGATETKRKQDKEGREVVEADPKF